MQLRQQLLYTCLPETMQNALRDGDLEGMTSRSTGRMRSRRVPADRFVRHTF